MTVEVERFAPGAHGEWARFVAEARNGVFLFQRGCMGFGFGISMGRGSYDAFYVPEDQR